MENLNIAVVSPDVAYNRAFCMSLLDACRQFSVSSFTTSEFTLQWEDYEGPGAFNLQFDLILWAGDDIKDAYGGNIVYLTDRNSLVNMDFENSRFALYKYSRADAVVSAVFDIYSHLTGRQMLLVKRKDVKLYAFASCCGGTGCTTAARAVGQELSRFCGKRVLHLSLEEVDSGGDFLPLQYGSPPEGIRTEAEYLYRLLCKDALPLLESYLMKDAYGISSFAPPAGKNPMRDLTEEEMNRLLAALMESGGFDVIIADVSTSLGEAAMAVFGAADRICVTSKTADPGMREIYYMNQLLHSCGESIQDRIIRMRRPAGWPDAAEHDPAAPLEGKYGQEIRILTERLLNMVE